MTLAYAFEPQPAPRRAHVIVVGNQKGGAGKSTVAMHLMVALMRMGRRTGVLDLDVRQRTLTRYIENRARWIASAARNCRRRNCSNCTRAARGRWMRPRPRRSRRSAPRCAGSARPAISSSSTRPGGDSFLSRLAHACADTLITPLNDSFVDFDLLGDIDPRCAEIVRPSIYSEMVWESRKRKAAALRTPIDWVVLRNRTSASRIEAKNKQTRRRGAEDAVQPHRFPAGAGPVRARDLPRIVSPGADAARPRRARAARAKCA